jgi:hypothetical protein
MGTEKEIRKRELEIQRLLRQMKFDQLNQGKVYRNLEEELMLLQTKQNAEEEVADRKA